LLVVAVVCWLDLHPATSPDAARNATAAVAVTKRLRKPACLVKNCLCGQETGRSKSSVQRRGHSRFFVQSEVEHRIDTRTANFLAWLSDEMYLSWLIESQSNSQDRNHLVPRVVLHVFSGTGRALLSRHAGD
jgi:hypothetical protein